MDLHASSRPKGRTSSFAIVATLQGPGPVDSDAAPSRGDRHRGHFGGLDPDRLYTITVTPRNTASTGRATSATMSKALNEITGTASAPAAPYTPPSP